MKRKKATEGDPLQYMWSHPRIAAKVTPSPVVLRMTTAWVAQGLDPEFLAALICLLIEDHHARKEEVLGSQLRKTMKRIFLHLSKARETFETIDGLPFHSAETALELIKHFYKTIDDLFRLLAVMGGGPMRHGRVGERYITEFIYLLSHHLRKLQGGRPQWRKIAEILNNLLGTYLNLNVVKVKNRCGRVTTVQGMAIREQFNEFRQVWENARTMRLQGEVKETR